MVSFPRSLKVIFALINLEDKIQLGVRNDWESSTVHPSPGFVPKSFPSTLDNSVRDIGVFLSNRGSLSVFQLLAFCIYLAVLYLILIRYGMLLRNFVIYLRFLLNFEIK